MPADVVGVRVGIRVDPGKSGESEMRRRRVALVSSILMGSDLTWILQYFIDGSRLYYVDFVYSIYNFLTS